MEAALTVFALLFLLAVVLGVYATVKAVGAAKRSVDRGITQARRTVEDHTLRAKSLVQVGPAGELAQLRLKLRTSMRATQDALHARVAEDESLKESLALFERLSAHGFELDGELRRLESEPDRATLAERLPGLRERTERVIRSADALRWAARDRARRFADDDLDSLSAQIDVEAGALRHWTETEPGAGLGAEPAAAPQSWPEAPSAEAPSTRQTWPDPPAQGPAEEDATRPAITPPAASPVYPWQKKARPESTT
ncbi:hypothetical protein BSZ07_12935 [Streptomyces sp. M1013]|uniref:hypothetical protein n=1 Tax=Streptomyces sp. M1013 TaxID=549798 RepID=UPI000978FF7F|nr:hypothetical protein [Streptomyces sp. M1013]OMI88984.1 hypothetical protein BSZ07_12935 [Streptomyces sp. M1013]